MDKQAFDAPKMKARIGIILPSLSHGGAERVASALADVWVNSNCDVSLITYTDLAQFFQLSPQVRHENVVVDGRWSVGPIRLLLVAWKIRRIVRQRRLEVVLSFMDKYNIFTLGALLFTGVPVVISDRSSPAKKRPFWLACLKRLAYPLASGVIAQTRQAADSIKAETGARDVVVIPNPVQVPSTAARAAERKKIILSVGRLVPEKGHSILIRAFARVRSDGWTLVILGDGPLRESLEHLVVELGVNEDVQFLGAVRDVEYWYRRASLFVLSSILEGFPNALVEAMGSGVPCVSFDCVAGPSDIIENGVSGILVSPIEVESLADAIAPLLKSEARRVALGHAARVRAGHFRQELVAAQYLAYCLAKAKEPRCE